MAWQRKKEIRNPNVEIRNKFKRKDQKVQNIWSLYHSDFESVSDFGFVSDFDIRISIFV